MLHTLLFILLFSLDEIILDIYNQLVELSSTDYEQLQNDLYALHQTPIQLNATSEEELQQLYFLSPRQIDDLLAYADAHPFESLYELRLIPSLTDFDIRNLLPFVAISPATPYNAPNAREVFARASHEIITRIDVRNIEHFKNDPVFVQTRYRFDYQRQVTFGAQLRRPAGGLAKDLQYGAYLQIRDIGHLHTLVAGNYQASFGQGLVMAPVFHAGKSSYVSSVGQQTEGLRYYSSADGNGLHGLGATLRWEWHQQTRLDVTAFYSLQRANDSTWHHLVGANLSLRHKRLHIQLSAIENIWSDSIHPYYNAAYNAHYFRGFRQAVLGASFRYNHGWFDLFGELATSQNHPQWGFGTLIGSRFYPADGVSLIAIYRYYSPYFDNALGYAFSETGRIGDENGGYVGLELTRWKNWRISAYADFFYFSGIKYGIPSAPSWGYDVLGEARYSRSVWWLDFRLRARQKGSLTTCSSRFQFNYEHHGLALRSNLEANLCPSASGSTYGVSVWQDIHYRFLHTPLALYGRLQFFDARSWNNRIYCYEHDVLYAFSIPAVYGLGGRAYLGLQWRIIEQLSLYLRVSETMTKSVLARTDIHLLLRASL